MDFQPAVASQIAKREVERRDHITELGPLLSGYDEIDHNPLLGGFSRGCITGISARDEDATALPIAIRTVVGSLARGDISGAAIVTRLPTPLVLSRLRHAASLELPLSYDRASKSDIEKQILRRVTLHTVFDVDGLWQVLAELEELCTVPSPTGRNINDRAVQMTEIADSDDEDYSIVPDHSVPPKKEIAYPLQEIPGVIVVTGIADILAGLFTQRTRPTAHDLITNMNLRLRRISHSLHSYPLILLLNTIQPSLARDWTRGTSAELRVREGTSLHNAEYGNDKSPHISSHRFGINFTSLLDVHIVCGRMVELFHNSLATEAPNNGDERQDIRRCAPFISLDEFGTWEKQMGPRRERGRNND